jgi:purine nucleosidase
MKLSSTFSCILAVSWLGLTCLFGTELPAPQAPDSPEAAGALKVIIDTDFNTIGDDGQVLVMAAQLAAQGRLDLLGITLATGNQWLDQEQADALKAVERLGIEKQVRVYRGALYPLVHDYKAYLYEKQLFLGHDYVGAYATPPPTHSQLVAPPDGFAAHAQAAQKSAIHFLIETIHRYPHEVNILAIGPLTNLALAIREDPTIVPLIKQIVFMGGQVDTIGNAFDDAGEFNWWFDPEAAKVVLRAEVPHIVVPLDATNTVPLTKQVFDRITETAHPTVVTNLYEQNFASFFGSKPPPFAPYIYDTLALAVLVDPSLATQVQDRYLDINTDELSPDYGKVTGYRANLLSNLLQKDRVVFEIDTSRFLDLYVDLLTRPVPVTLPAGQGIPAGNGS